MSLLEDIYVEDEVEFSGDLERIVEGGDDVQDDRNSGDDDEDDRNSHSEAEEEKPRIVNPDAEKKAKVVRNPRFVLNPARLMGPRGVSTIEDFFKDFKFRGKDHEKEDLDMVMKKLEHWAHRLYPKFQFDDCLDKIASLGNKKIIQVHMRKIRLNMLQNDDGVVRQIDSDNEDVQTATNAPEMDEFDLLLEQQIALARSTPATNMKNSSFNNQTPITTNKNNSVFNNVSTSMQTPKPPATASPQLTEEQKARMMKNRMLAEERRLARMKENMEKENAAKADSNDSQSVDVINANKTVSVNDIRNAASNKDLNNKANKSIEMLDLDNDLVVNNKSNDVSMTRNEDADPEKLDDDIDIDKVVNAVQNTGTDMDRCNGAGEMMDVDDVVLSLRRTR